MGPVGPREASRPILNVELDLNYPLTLDCSLNNYDISGGILRKIPDTRDWLNCQYQCYLDLECNFWTYRASAKMCWFHNKVEKIVKGSGYRIGQKKCMTEDDVSQEKSELMNKQLGKIP